MTNRMDRVFLFKPVEENMMEVGKMIYNKVQVWNNGIKYLNSRLGLMVPNMKGISMKV